MEMRAGTTYQNSKLAQEYDNERISYRSISF